jgi:hypothetical protein
LVVRATVPVFSPEKFGHGWWLSCRSSCVRLRATGSWGLVTRTLQQGVPTTRSRGRGSRVSVSSGASSTNC